MMFAASHWCRGSQHWACSAYAGTRPFHECACACHTGHEKVRQGVRFYCSVCGVRWPCLAVQNSVVQMMSRGAPADSVHGDSI